MTSTEVVRKRKNRNKPHGNDDDEESNNNGSAVSTGGRLFIRKKKTSFMAKNHILSVTVIGIIIMSMVILAPKYLNVSTTAISKPQKIKQQHQQYQYQQHQQQPLPQLPKLNMEQIMKNSNLPLLGIRPFTDTSNSKYPQFTTKVSSLTPMVYYPYGDIQDILHPFDEEFRRKDFLMKEFEERKSKKQVTFYKEDEAVSNSNIDHYNKYFITTRRSYKGGPKENQVNQDRAIVIHPYPFLRQQKQQNQSFSMMIGIFDGHGEKGQLAAHFVQQYLPTLLATNLSKLQPQPQSQQAEDTNVNKNNDIVKQTLIDTFATVDEAMPSNIAFIAGCTTSIIIQTSNDTIYTANTGDSSTFLFMYIKSIKKVQILYISAKHKGDEILERQRIESMGGKVVLPAMKERTINGVLTEMTSRVVIPGGPGYGAVTLAMSRSMGDKGGRQVGVISEPTVDVLNLPSLIRKAMSDQGITIQDSSINDDVELFAVAASDGLMDFMKPIDIAEHVTHGLYSHGDVDGDSSSSKSLEEICEQIILEASNVWLQFGQRYRDDITIAVSKVEV